MDMRKYGIILAAGRGTRMPNRKIPKVLISLKGRPIVWYLIKAFKKAGIKKPILIVGYKKELVKAEFGDSVDYVIQDSQLGTGHAVLMAENRFKNRQGAILIAYGDMPLWDSRTIERLYQTFINSQAKLVLVTVDLPNSFAYGRIIRNKQGQLERIVEEKDCSDDQLKIKEKNPGLYLVDSSWLFEALRKIKADNVQKEYYLTDIVEIAVRGRISVETVKIKDSSQAIGINTAADFNLAERVLDEKLSS